MAPFPLAETILRYPVTESPSPDFTPNRVMRDSPTRVFDRTALIIQSP
jgi:hypothetical protein